MRKGSLIDDVNLRDWEDQGPPILFTNPEIRRMLTLAKAGRGDVFYDLGSGWGQNLIIALTEYHVKKTVGVEKDRERYAKSLERLKKCGISADRWNLIREDFEKVLAGRVKELDPKEATIVFYGLSMNRQIFDSIAKNLRRRARLVYYYKCVFPETMPDRVEFPFYLSIAPFRPPRSQREWLMSIVPKRWPETTRNRPTLRDLWDELRHDYDVEGIGDPIRLYRARLEKAVER